MSNKMYDFLKWIAQYLLPAIGALYVALAEIWHLPFGSEIAGTVAAVDTFLGIVLGISSNKYHKELEEKAGGQSTIDGGDL